MLYDIFLTIMISCILIPDVLERKPKGACISHAISMAFKLSMSWFNSFSIRYKDQLHVIKLEIPYLFS